MSIFRYIQNLSFHDTGTRVLPFAAFCQQKNQPCWAPEGGKKALRKKGCLRREKLSSDLARNRNGETWMGFRPLRILWFRACRSLDRNARRPLPDHRRVIASSRKEMPGDESSL